MLLAMAVSVTLVMGDASSTDVRVVPNGFMPFEDCEVWVRNMRTAPVASVDPVTGKRLVARYFHCIPVRPGEMEESLQSAIDQFQ